MIRLGEPNLSFTRNARDLTRCHDGRGAWTRHHTAPLSHLHQTLRGPPLDHRHSVCSLSTPQLTSLPPPPVPSLPPASTLRQSFTIPSPRALFARLFSLLFLYTLVLTIPRIPRPLFSLAMSTPTSSSSLGRPVVKVFTATKQLEGGGFEIRRPFPTASLSQVDPFLLFDHMGPMVSEPHEAIGAPDHPHRGFETITYLLQGSMEHQDSFGHKGKIQTGGVQWMTAGSGLVHSEMPSQELLERGGALEGFQVSHPSPAPPYTRPPPPSHCTHSFPLFPCVSVW